MSPRAARTGPTVDKDALASIREPAKRITKAPAEDPVAAAGSLTPRAAQREARRTASAEKERVGFYQHPDATNAARAAFYATREDEGCRSFSDFIARAIAKEVTRLQDTYNGGRAWPPLEAGDLPVGRPVT